MTKRSLLTMLRQGVSELHPAYFALVMATGIISLAFHLRGIPAIALPLFFLNIAFYGALLALSVMRLSLYPRRIGSDMLHHGRAVGFFTTVAGTCVLGSQFLLIRGNIAVATGLWFLGLALWCLFTYTIFTGLTVKTQKPPLEQGINGGWLVSVVATQSVSVLGSQLALHFGSYQEFTLFLSLCFWLGGSMLYIWLISMIFYRYLFFTLEPSDLAPPYWINMGAMAISTLAGTMLVAAAPHSPLLQQLLPFLKGFTTFFWATATWWIPMLIILGIWRHLYRRFPLRYDPLYWGAVFPLGMYSTCTFRLSEVLALPFLASVAVIFSWVALTAWTLVFLGLVSTTVLGAVRPGRV